MHAAALLTAALAIALLSWTLVILSWIMTPPAFRADAGDIADRPRICSAAASHVCTFTDAGRYVCDNAGAPFSDGLRFHLPVAPVFSRHSPLPSVDLPDVFIFQPQPDAMRRLGCAWLRLTLRYAMRDGTHMLLDGPVDNFTGTWVVRAEVEWLDPDGHVAAVPHEPPPPERVAFDVVWDWHRSYLLLSPRVQAAVDRVAFVVAVGASLAALILRCVLLRKRPVTTFSL